MDIRMNDFCDITNILTVPDIKQGTDIIALSLFKMDQGYKNFDKYVNGLTLLVKRIRPRLPQFQIILFVDNSIVKDEVVWEKISQMKNDVTLIKYHCPKFIKDGKHQELFGTLVRFLPFFDYPGNPCNMVISLDVDNNEEDIKYVLTDYNIFAKSRSQYHYNTNTFYELIAKWSLSDTYTILAGRHMCKVKWPLHLLTHYLECVRTKSCSDKQQMNQKLDFTKYSTFPYGIDEYFLNYVILPYIRKQDIIYSVTVRYGITAPMYYLVWFKNQNYPGLLKFLRGVMNDKNGDVKSLYRQFDKIFYNLIYDEGYEPNENAKKIAKQYYKAVQNLYDKQDFSVFEKKTLEKILGYKNKRYIRKTMILSFQGERLIKKKTIDRLKGR